MKSAITAGAQPANVAKKAAAAIVATTVPDTDHNSASAKPLIALSARNAPVTAPVKHASAVRAMDQLANEVVQRRCGCKTSSLDTANATPSIGRRIVVPVAP